MAKRAVKKAPAKGRAKGRAPGGKAGKTAKAKVTKVKTAGGEAAVEEASGAPQPESQPGRAEALGQVAWLMQRSPSHRHLFLADLEWLVIPPVMLRQFRIFSKDNTPVAYASWANVNEETAERLSKGIRRLRPGDWNGGSELWLIDLVAPFGGGNTVLKELREKTFAGRKVKSLSPAADGKGLKVVEW